MIKKNNHEYFTVNEDLLRKKWLKKKINKTNDV